MIHSMTGYARYEHKADWGSAVWELRSVNQRYLETNLRLPESVRAMENALREQLRKKLNRGKVDCNLRLHIEASAQTALNLNEDLANSVLASAKWVNEQGAAHGNEMQPVDALDVLRWPGVVAAEEQDMDALQKELMGAFHTALKDFISNRASEGEALNKLIVERLEGVETQVAQVREQMPKVMQWQRERLQNRFEEAKIDLDPQRLEQEMVMLAQKTDVAEELDRLIAHVAETRKILNKGGACGRRLDFMMQEFNREANTLGSKSIDADITAAAVELKVLIEQMREQIQNIE
ncbi:YicC family protein [Idiomarina tyrosinivorans]|uniref:YicC family protein n=1 Tax=Idiomarina tyrosinivorans TaxID=1445662 RepID=A0A432ZPY3_9GAMM|nr:YicC/YloC family endoribonuclease [Idiomarina tyrosinivorans]RUO79964.1 YicC family protein [Idiomarina tyrosinivorans]